MPAKPISPHELGLRIRQSRQQIGMTQLTLAHCIGHVGPDAGAYICKVEKGITDPQIGTLRRIAKALQIQVSELLK